MIDNGYLKQMMVETEVKKLKMCDKGSRVKKSGRNWGICYSLSHI